MSETAVAQIAAERALVRRVFGTEDGQALLKMLAEQHIWTPIATSDTNKTFMRLGQQELIINFLNIMGDNNE